FLFFTYPDLHSFPTRRSSDLELRLPLPAVVAPRRCLRDVVGGGGDRAEVRQRVHVDVLAVLGHTTGVGGVERLDRRAAVRGDQRSEEHTSELQSRENLVCRLL